MSEYYSIAPYSAELYHHGVKGQKWGVRRFQNADGSLTAAGKRREAKNSVKAAIRAAKGYDNDLNPDYVKARQHMKKAAVEVGKEQANKILKSQLRNENIKTGAFFVGLTSVAVGSQAVALSQGYIFPRALMATPVVAIGGIKVTAETMKINKDVLRRLEEH